jgi:hypothetical protein
VEPLKKKQDANQIDPYAGYAKDHIKQVFHLPTERYDLKQIIWKVNA